MSNPYGLTYWMNALTDLWKQVVVSKKAVKSYRYDNIPESVTEFPSAISFIENVDTAYSVGGSVVSVYSGKTEFHLSAGLVRAEMGFVMQFPDKIIAAAASSITLGGMVTDFRLISPVTLARLVWGSELEHFGVVAAWTVQENQTGKVSVAQ